MRSAALTHKLSQNLKVVIIKEIDAEFPSILYVNFASA